jgi:hypothetical protein
MKITLDQRDDELFVHLEAETVPDAAQLLILCRKQLSPNAGRAWAGSDSVAGWIMVPLSRVPASSVHSGNRKY